MKAVIKKCLGQTRWEKLRRFVRLAGVRHDLTRIAEFFGCDKTGNHSYTQHYAKHLEHLRKRKFNLLEIGVGGHEHPTSGGASLRMWKLWCPKASIFGIDYFDKSALQEPRITIFKGSQNDPEFLKSVAKSIGRLDVVIDDGSHINEHVLTSFNSLFPLLDQDGIYVIEDTHTSYDERFGGSDSADATNTSMSLVKSLIDGLNWQEFVKSRPPEIGKHIVAVHCYHNIVFIKKGQNLEGGHNDEKHRVHSNT